MIIDLCSGYGGATQTFLNEDVIKIDIDPKVKPSIVADISHLPLKPKLKPRLLWASPPCKHFSNARLSNRRYGTAFNPCGFADSLRLVASIYDAIDYLQPITWIIENPHGYLRCFLGNPTIQIEYSTPNNPHKRTDLWSNKKSLQRAFIPLKISRSIKDFIEST